MRVSFSSGSTGGGGSVTLSSLGIPLVENYSPAGLPLSNAAVTEFALYRKKVEPIVALPAAVGGIITLALNTNYEGPITASVEFQIAGTPAAGNWVNVSGVVDGSYTLTVPSGKRIGEAAAITTIAVTAATFDMGFFRTASDEWWIYDSAGAAVAGDMVGPSGATDDRFFLADGATGKLARQSAQTYTATIASIATAQAAAEAAQTTADGKQASDADLTDIAGLTPSNDDVMQRKAGAWANRTIAQLSADLTGTGLVATNVALRHIPQNSQSAAYTTVAADAGKHIFHPSADTTAREWIIDSNANVPYLIGTALTFVNQNGAGVLTISITTDTMRLAGAGTTGSRTLAANGIATALKVTSTEWLISGTGLT